MTSSTTKEPSNNAQQENKSTNWKLAKNDDTSRPVFLNPLGTENPENIEATHNPSWIKQFQYILITKGSEPNCIPLSTNINLNCKKRMLYFPIYFGELTIDALTGTGAIFSAFPEMDLRKILSTISNPRKSAPNFQVKVANGQLETPKSTFELKFENGEVKFYEILIVMVNWRDPSLDKNSFRETIQFWTWYKAFWIFRSFRCSSKQLTTDVPTSWSQFSVWQKSPFYQTIES